MESFACFGGKPQRGGERRAAARWLCAQLRAPRQPLRFAAALSCLAAWARGLRQRRVILKHALRNALIPLVTLITIAFPGLFGGAILVERVFSYPGMGLLYFKALSTADWPVMMLLLVISSFLVVISNILADVLYVLIDPRIKYS